MTLLQPPGRATTLNWSNGSKAKRCSSDRMYNTDDRHATPFFTAFGLTNKWMTPGVEIHANTLRTLLTGRFPAAPFPNGKGSRRSFCRRGWHGCRGYLHLAVSQTAVWSLAVLAMALILTHLAFLAGWLLSSADVMMAFGFSLIGGVVYRFATAEKKSSFFKSAVALFVGKDVAKSLDQSGTIGLTGQRRTVTILFSDIRGFTAFCESKDPAVIVDLLNVYMATMCAIIVKYHGHVNKFIGDGILAVFSDVDDGAEAGRHALRAVQCATEMVTAPGEFGTGTGLHSGEVVIGNVGSSDKMEFTVLGDTVNLASRLESLNKEHRTKLLLSGATCEMAGGAIDTVYLGAVPVRGKTEPMKLYTVASLMTDEIRQTHHFRRRRLRVTRPTWGHAAIARVSSLFPCLLAAGGLRRHARGTRRPHPVRAGRQSPPGQHGNPPRGPPRRYSFLRRFAPRRRISGKLLILPRKVLPDSRFRR